MGGVSTRLSTCSRTKPNRQANPIKRRVPVLRQAQGPGHRHRDRTAPLLDKRPDEPPEDGIAEADQPGLGPVEIGVSGLGTKEAEGMEGVVGGPFALEGADGAVPDEAVGVLLAHGQELGLEVGLRDFEGRLEVDVRGRDGVPHPSSSHSRC